MTKKLSGSTTHIEQLHGCQVEWTKESDGWKMKELEGTDFVLKADLVLLALGFVHVEHEGLITDLGLQPDNRGNVIVNNYQTSNEWLFAVGDTINGASLVVHAINSGRQGAAAINRWLMKEK